MTDLETIEALGNSPLSGGSPAGASVRYEPDFESLQAEIDKMGSASGGPVLWREVRDLSTRILAERSKDLLVAAYLVASLLEVDGVRGMSVGLSMFRDLLGTFWEEMFPPLKKIRAREAAVSWLDEHGARALTGRSVSDGDREALESSLAAAEAIAELARERFGGEAPRLASLSRAIRERIDAIPPPPAPEAEEETAEEEAPPEPPPPVVVKEEVDSPRKARDAVLEAVTFLRGSRPEDPRPYSLLRALLWDEILEPPPDEGGATEVSGGDPEALASWEQALEAKEHEKVLEEAESRLAEEPLWLDLNFLSVRALEGLGDGLAPCRRAIAAALGTFLERLPGLETLRFRNEIPFASEATRLWIEGEVLRPAGGKPAAPDRHDETLREARRLASRGQLPEATALFQREMQAAPAGRERFLLRLELGKLCLRAGQAGLALPVFESLDEEGARFRIEEWETGLAVEIVKLLWHCYTTFREHEGFSEKAAQAYSRLCRLDLTEAMSLKKKPGKRFP